MSNIGKYECVAWAWLEGWTFFFIYMKSTLQETSFSWSSLCIYKFNNNNNNKKEDQTKQSVKRAVAVCLIVAVATFTIDGNVHRLFMKPTFSLHSLRSYMSLSSFNNAHRPLFREIIGRTQCEWQQHSLTQFVSFRCWHTLRTKCRLEQQKSRMLCRDFRMRMTKQATRKIK